MRALGVTRDGKEGDGEISVDQLETRWTFTPKGPWRAGSYQLLALDILEDVAGNQIGRAFEVDNFESVDREIGTGRHDRCGTHAALRSARRRGKPRLRDLGAVGAAP